VLRITLERYEDAQDCPFRNALDKVADKWGFLIFAALEDGPKRFNEIGRDIGDISQRVLTRKLRGLQRDGFVSRTVYPHSPPHVEYALTELGQSALVPVRYFLEWSLEANAQVTKAREASDAAGAL
jgi:DNA-binding HxlR family transcriptional regulator